jgi:hypothetical protein
VVLFLHNKDIDHLYSFSNSTQGASVFAPDSIRMKSNLGLVGKAFNTGKVQTDYQLLIAEERDLTKLKLKEIKNASAVPVKKGT